MAKGQGKAIRKNCQSLVLKRLPEEECWDSTAIYREDPNLSWFTQDKKL